MEPNTIMSIISTLGFPIAVSVGLFWYLIKTNTNNREDTDKLRESLDRNTEVLIRLEEKMEVN